MSAGNSVKGYMRLKAEERRDEIVAAARAEFARGGYAATSTQGIARRVGVSQPYVFQLFGTKKELFLAAVRDCFARTSRRFEEAARKARAEGCGPEQVLERMGAAYIELVLADRDLLRLQLHAYAAAADPEIGPVVREEFFRLWHTVARVAGVEPIQLHDWFAQGMLINVIASISEARTAEEVKVLLCGGVSAVT